MHAIAMSDFGEKDWEDCYDLYERIFKESYPYRELPSRQAFLHNPRPFTVMASGHQGFVICENEKQIACCHYKIKPDQKVLTSEVKFHRPTFNAQVAEFMVKELLAVCRAANVQILQMVAETEEVRNYFVSSGAFQKVGQIGESVLDIKQVNPVQLDAWLNFAKIYQLKGLNWDDETTTDAVAALYSEGLEDVPMQGVVGQTKRYERSYFQEYRDALRSHECELLAYGLYDKDTLAGIYLFECRRENPQTFLIYYTGISRKYRKQGLGKGLKAASLMQLRRDFPNIRYIVTGNEETNTPMLKINRAMGFTVRTEFTMLRFQGVI